MRAVAQANPSTDATANPSTDGIAYSRADDTANPSTDKPSNPSTDTSPYEAANSSTDTATSASPYEAANPSTDTAANPSTNFSAFSFTNTCTFSFPNNISNPITEPIKCTDVNTNTESNRDTSAHAAPHGPTDRATYLHPDAPSNDGPDVELCVRDWLGRQCLQHLRRWKVPGRIQRKRQQRVRFMPRGPISGR